MEAPIIKLIAEDARGASWSLYFPDLDAEMVIIYSKAGVYRGGHSHINKKETSMLLSGAAHYVKKFPNGGTVEFDEQPGEVLHNAEGEIHRAFFPMPSWLVDWKIDCKVGEAITVNDKDLRQLVDNQLVDKS